MKIARHNARTGQVEVRDATPEEEVAIEAHWATQVPTEQDLERAALRAITRKLLDAELAKGASDIPEVEALRAARKGR